MLVKLGQRAFKVGQQPRRVGVLGDGLLGVLVALDGGVLGDEVAELFGFVHDLLRVYGHDAFLDFEFVSLLPIMRATQASGKSGSPRNRKCPQR